MADTARRCRTYCRWLAMIVVAYMSWRHRADILGTMRDAGVLPKAWVEEKS
ncbi:uncharacterized protein MICPUCDRAFT_49971 [Micromonas pusilla CCMP1545]|jgi:hypothetical protein|uniref:Predicted protein n=1 Tax=Micromonas pusilla (strain CCMP1545) TaxID=564608 RepID=C1MGX3_MICPC|nr:uncharacterized protein MICPUCDRAFT_49971 [Micromonas pusilla CCMP1545]EEH60104.1 predicted protein [Micromonas pusilla CCMP1545]|tara:strand:+ start:153 stop:305 length:153 start_codon:yes stop_codon:yes gene_type:complete|eukprot:XP_003054852.1 predicted protein [Micromonas pusilla CCMP1545]